VRGERIAQSVQWPTVRRDCFVCHCFQTSLVSSAILAVVHPGFIPLLFSTVRVRTAGRHRPGRSTPANHSINVEWLNVYRLTDSGNVLYGKRLDYEATRRVTQPRQRPTLFKPNITQTQLDYSAVTLKSPKPTTAGNALALRMSVTVSWWKKPRNENHESPHRLWCPPSLLSNGYWGLFP
jgi:hypothetical protein